MRTRPAYRVRRRARRRASLADRLTPFRPGRSWRLQLAGAAVTLLVAIFSAQSLASAADAIATGRSYLIQPGDTLTAIATATGTSLDRLVGLNGISNPNVIIAGQTLQLDTTSGATPAASATPGAAAPSGPLYTVKAGDTLWEIASANNVSVDALAKLNNLSDADQLSVGQQLKLPAPTQRAAQVRTPSQVPGGATASATPTPAATSPKVSAAALLQKVASVATKTGGPNVHVGIAAINLTTGDSVAWHADDEFPSASVMKLPILVELERQIATGSLSWTESLRAEANAMISVSDNTAANEIAQAIHPESVNASMSRLGLGGTQFINLFDEASHPGENQTTPANMARLLQLIATDQVVSPQASADIRNLLARNTDNSKLVRLLPPDARVAHKSGWFDGVANDVGVVSVDRVPTRWVIAVFTEHLPSAETGNQLIAAVSKTVYDAWAP